MKHCTIPDAWTGEQALAFVALLDRLSQAIWRAHGHEMAHYLERLHAGRDAHRPTGSQRLEYDNGPRFDYEPIPFPGR